MWKCSSRQAAILSSSSSLCSQKETTFRTVGRASVSVPVLSNTIVVAFAAASIYFPPFTVILCAPASRIADSTEIGIASLSAHENLPSVLPVPWSHLLSAARSESFLPVYTEPVDLPDVLHDFPDLISIFRLFDHGHDFSKRVALLTAFTQMISSPSSTTVPAYT